MIVLAFAAPASSQTTRHRIVKRAPAEATLSGIVLDAATRAPLAEAIIKAGNKAVTTGADGRFSLILGAGTYEMSITRWGYLPATRTVAVVAGANQLEITLEAAPIVTVRLRTGTTFPLDYDSVEFGHVIAFVGWSSGPRFHLCLPSGEEITVENADMRTVTFPGVRTEATSCCSLAPGSIVRITKRDGTVVEGTIKETCNGAVFYVRGRNRTTGQHDAIKIADVDSVTF
ncbi:MAG TPA: carboxypeptidase regulatory-like domain-containing protein, partial [Thermoanaerobaculia bacterium]|nr:carboxypeptidase regulatory-like domain-containing protein [Thermoanaerobaculia bacterium]